MKNANVEEEIMKRRIAILMSVVMMLAMCAMLSGCGEKESKSTPKTDEELIIGDWTAELDMTDLMSEAMMGTEEMEEMEEYFKFEGIAFKINMSFKEDGTCTLKVDEDSVEECMNLVIDQAIDGMILMMEDLTGMTFADMAAMSSMTEDEYKQALKDELLAEADMGEDFVAELGIEEETANYELKDGKIYTSETDYMAYELSGNELKITEIVEEGLDTDAEFSIDAFLPLVFTR